MPCIEKQNHEEKKRAQKKKNIYAKKRHKERKSDLKQNCTKCKNWPCMVVWQVESDV